MKTVAKIPILSITTFILLVVMMVSCQDFTFQTANPDKAVVKGYLFAGQNPTVNITKQLVYGSSDTVTHPIENLDVIIYDSEGAAYPLSYTSNGNYTSTNLTVKVGETYTLKFTYNDKELSATTTVPEKPVGFYGTSSLQVKPIGSGTPGMGRAEYYWTNDDSNYFLLVVENTESSPTAINDTTEYEAFHAFRQSPTQGSSVSLMGRAFYYYGKHNVILFSINKEYVDLYEDTGNSSQNITNPPGNITNGFGIFTAINADTLKLNIYP